MRFAFVAKHRGIWPVAWLCEALDVSRSGFHAWLHRTPSKRTRDDETIGAKVRASFTGSDRTYGARRVWRDVLAEGEKPCDRRHELLQELRGNVGSARREDVAIRIDGKPRLVHVIAERLADKGPEAGMVVMAFHDAGPAAARTKTGSAGHASDDALLAVEQELRTTRTQLQSTIDELETANEEMKSANEEYQSVNEELQSSNEELETAKEEMQSVNEELQTINTEIASKNEQLTLLNSDLANFLESTDIATLFLDLNLRVRRFTRGVGDVFHLRDADVGRPITEIVTLLDYGDLQRDVATVLRKLTPIERQVALQGAPTTFILRIRPYRTVDNVIDGVVLTFVDITDRQAAIEAIRVSEAKFRMLFDFIDEGFCIIERIETRLGEPSDFRYLASNPGFTQQCGIGNVVGKTIREIVPAEAQGWIEIYDEVLASGESIRFERELVTQGRTLEVFAFRFDDGSGHKVGVIFLDVSHRKIHDEQQELLLKEMDHRVKNLFSIAAGVVGLSARSAKDTNHMAMTIQGRLGALADAHQLVRPRRLGSGAAKLQTTLAEVVETVLRPYASGPHLDNAPRTEIHGPDIPVGGEAVTSLAMILHELATNAAKYGAFSSENGRVRVAWDVKKERLTLNWTESGGPAIKNPPSREGFGSVLARRSISGQLGGSLDFDWRPEGLFVRLSADVERLAV